MNCIFMSAPARLHCFQTATRKSANANYTNCLLLLLIKWGSVCTPNICDNHYRNAMFTCTHAGRIDTKLRFSTDCRQKWSSESQFCFIPIL